MALAATFPFLLATKPTLPKPPVPVTGGEAAVASPASDRIVQRGFEWLVAHQLPNGGFAQGEESTAMSGSSVVVRDTPNVADTCMATLALLHGGNTPQRGPHAASIRRAVDFVCTSVEQAPVEGLAVTQLTGTRVQAKLGSHVDTFLAALLLAEVKDDYPAGRDRQRVDAALAKVVRKIEVNQQRDGTWTKDGWAPALNQGLASKALNRAAEAGVSVDEGVRERAEKWAQSQFDARTGFKGEGSAGVELYSASAAVGSMQESDRINARLERKLRDDLKRQDLPAEERAQAAAKIATIETNDRALAEAQAAVVDRMEDASFAAGFGSNGGEEFLSHLSIGESLFAKGGAEWTKWRDSMGANMARVQNADGSWSGHHCITGRTFCTSAALMCLTIEQASKPLAGKIRG